MLVQRPTQPIMRKLAVVECSKGGPQSKDLEGSDGVGERAGPQDCRDPFEWREHEEGQENPAATTCVGTYSGCPAQLGPSPISEPADASRRRLNAESDRGCRPAEPHRGRSRGRWREEGEELMPRKGPELWKNIGSAPPSRCGPLSLVNSTIVLSAIASLSSRASN